MEILIRKAIPDEAEQIIDISIEVWNTTYKGIIPQDTINKLQSKDKSRIERQHKSIEKNNNIYVALVDGKIVGFHIYGKSKDETFKDSGEIYAGYILEEYQGLGLGRKMAIACMMELLKEGYTTMITKCLINNPSNEFHKSLGGILVGKSPFEALGIYVGEENIYYHEDLEKSLEINKEKLKKKKK